MPLRSSSPRALRGRGFPSRQEALVGRDLRRHGLRVREGELLISNSAEAIGRILADTAWATNWSTILGRLPGVNRSVSMHFRGLGTSRSVALPLAALAAADP